NSLKPGDTGRNSFAPRPRYAVQTTRSTLRRRNAAKAGLSPPGLAVVRKCSGALALALVDFLEVGVDHLLVAAALAAALRAAAVAAGPGAALGTLRAIAARGRAGLLGRRLIHGFADLHQGLQQGIGL